MITPRATGRLFAIAATVVFALLSASCVRKAPTQFVSQQQLVEEYNANAAGVPRLWARARITVNLPDSPINPSFDGKLLLSKADNRFGPQNFVLIGNETLAVEVFRMGSSNAQGLYYLWYKAGSRGAKAYVGQQRYAGAPCVKDLPFDPNQLPAVLAVCELPHDQIELPAVSLRFTSRPGQVTNTRPAYVLTYIDRQALSRQIGVRRDVYFNWDDNPATPRRPFMVCFYDLDGQHRMTAYLKDYRSVKIEDLDFPPAQAPLMPTDITLEYVTDSGRVSRIHLALSEMTTADKWDVEAVDFDRSAFPAESVIQVDSACDTEGPRQ